MEQTALVVPVPRAAPLVEPLRLRYSDSAALGVPPHVTILAPVLQRITHADLEALEEVVGRVPATSVELTDVGMFEEGEVLHLLPDDPTPFLELAAAVRARFPDVAGRTPPDDYVPHLTVGHRIPRPTARHVARSLLLALPVRIPVHTVQLWVARADEAMPVATFPMGVGEVATAG